MAGGKSGVWGWGPRGRAAPQSVASACRGLYSVSARSSFPWVPDLPGLAFQRRASQLERDSLSYRRESFLLRLARLKQKGDIFLFSSLRQGVGGLVSYGSLGMAGTVVVSARFPQRRASHVLRLAPKGAGASYCSARFQQLSGGMLARLAPITRGHLIR